MCLITNFIFGSSIIVGVSLEVGQDAWIAQILSALMSIPVLMLYARLIRLNPEKNLYDIFISLFGNFAGKIFILIMVWYALHLGGLVLVNFTGFIKTVSLIETPLLPIMTIILIVVIYMVKSGIETMGKYSLIIMPIIIFVAVTTTLFSLNQMDFTNILPIMGHSVSKIASTSFKSLTFPYAETVLFLCVADSFNKNDSPYKIYIWAVIISTIIIVIILLRNIELMGCKLMEAEYFPSYIAVTLIKISDFIQRLEGSISMSFILMGTIKISVCLLAASKGLAKLFELKNYRQIVLPAGLATMSLSAIVYRNIMELYSFLDYYQFYAIPFQFAIPLTVWIFSELKARKDKQKKEAAI